MSQDILAQAENLEPAHRLIHTIKGVAGNLGARALFDKARELETAIKKNHRDVWPERLADFEQTLNQVLASVDTMKPTDPSQEEVRGLAEAVPLNLEEVTALLIELINLLKTNDAKSEACAMALKTRLRGTVAQNEVQQLEACMDQFDFTGAQASVASIAQVLNVSL